MRSQRGFTLMELMVVCAIIGAALLLVPPRFDTFGARSRLSSGANTVMSELVATREQAILDGYEARWEVGRFRTGKGDDDRAWGTRFWFTNIPAMGTAGSEGAGQERARERATSRAEERQWMRSEWRELPRGVRVTGVSLEAGQWEKIGDGERTFTVRFFADGAVERGFGVRVESEDLDVRLEDRTVTVLCNPLTAEPSSVEGLAELSKQKTDDEFK